MIDDWTPAQEDIDWTQSHFDSMAIGDTWSVSGALLEKSGDKELVLRQYPAESSMAVERVANVCSEIGIVLDTKDAQLIEDPVKAAQDAAQEWTCPDTNIPLVNFNLEGAVWSMNVVPSEDEQGESMLIEQWAVRITHPNEDGDEHEVFMTPMDYHMIAGDDVFFTWREMRVIEREEAIRIADDIILELLEGRVILLGESLKQDEEEHIVPPHMRGMLVKTTSLGEEE